MKYKDLKEILDNFSKEQLDREVLVWSMDETDFIDGVDFNYKGNIEIAKASDQLNDENATYFVI
tara:strand:+ start:255 stop:446 length:192 start_codon:yes stop_codon:yes gene_type:complete